MKKILVLMVSLLFIGANLYAQGDLKVGGKIGVGLGAGTPSSPLDIVSAGGTALLINADTQDSPEKGATAFLGAANFLGGDAFTRSLKGAKYNIDIEGASDNNNATLTDPEFIAQENMLTIGNANYTGTYTFNTQLTGIRAQFQRLTNNARPMTFSDVYGFWSMSGAGIGGLGTITFTNYYHYYVADFDNSATMSATNQYGLYIPNLNGATNNYGIVLDGEGAGSDIVFGDSGGTRPRIYSEGGFIYADDAFGSHTKISPHDPETGEWVYYSKNLRTGKVVKVNMEKLVKAVEKITGETFMVETIEE